MEGSVKANERSSRVINSIHTMDEPKASLTKQFLIKGFRSMYRSLKFIYSRLVFGKHRARLFPRIRLSQDDLAFLTLIQRRPQILVSSWARILTAQISRREMASLLGLWKDVQMSKCSVEWTWHERRLKGILQSLSYIRHADASEMSINREPDPQFIGFAQV